MASFLSQLTFLVSARARVLIGDRPIPVDLKMLNCNNIGKIIGKIHIIPVQNTCVTVRLPRLEKNVNVYTEDTNRNVHVCTSIKYLRKVSANLPHNIPDMNTLA